jgi:glycosyltransferase involved in cell wall biosynthesis
LRFRKQLYLFMNNNLPLVSVIVATYNGDKYLLEQLDSIANQTYKNIEIIICDDDSFDNTKKIIKDFAESHKRVFYYLNISNQGVNKNFEQGFLKATGEFVAISDQDDIWKPEKIEKQMLLFKTEDIILVHSGSLAFIDNSLPLNKTSLSGSKQMTGNDPKKLLLRNTIAGHNIIFRKKLLHHILPLPENVYYDWWLCEVATCYGEIAATNQVLAYQRYHDQNLTLYNRTTKKQTIREYNERINAIKTFITIKNLKQSDKKFMENLLSKMETLENRNFSIKLFFFLLKNTPTFFFYKTKWIPYLSYIKAAYRMSFKVKA